jgi:enoyl-CoA hydratase/3-hydroxyacyl-CoA dehydrogenase
MGTSNHRVFRKLAVVGAGNMGSGIAQKMASEGFAVTLLDLDDEKVARGVDSIRRTVEEGVERKIFRPERAAAIVERVHGTSDWSELADVDLVVEAVFEDLDVKREVFGKLDGVCRADAILATNTSSFAVDDIAEGSAHPGRVIGLHYFYHPAKNRLVEVVPGRRTDVATTRAAWSLQEQLGKTPIASADTSGFIVNRYFVAWLNEAVRLLEEDVATIATIEAACKKTFGVGMGPFELMNVTGVPIAMHAATTLGEAFGPFYAPCDRLRSQVASGDPWPLDGAADESAFETVSERMLAVTFYVAAALVDEGVGTIEDTDIGARVGLRWPRGPFQMINRYGVQKAAGLVAELAKRFDFKVPNTLASRTEAFRFEVVRSATDDGIATLTINRPDAMNALNEDVVAQLHAFFRDAVADPAVRGIVIAGAGKAFIAGADIRFFVKNIDAKKIDRIVEFTEAGHALLADIAACAKPVVARMHGLTLGGGLELALACHRSVASNKAALAFPETGIGIYPGLGGTQRATRRVGVGLAKWLIYTGQILPANEARDIGMIDQVVPHAELDAAIRQLIETDEQPSSLTWPLQFTAIERFFKDNPVEQIRLGKADAGDDEKLLKPMQRVATKAPVALRIAETLIEFAEDGDLEAGLRLELEHLPEIFATADAYEGLSSLGKRKPAFKGH